MLRDAGECVSATELGDAGAKQVARLLLAGVRLQQRVGQMVGGWGSWVGRERADGAEDSGSEGDGA